MGLLQIKLTAAVKKDWDALRARPEFTFMPQIGVLAALIRCYLTHNAAQDVKGKPAAELSGAERKAAIRLAHIRSWAKMDMETRQGNITEYMQYADPELVERFESEWLALNHEALQYE